MLLETAKYLVKSKISGYGVHSPYLYNFAIKVLNFSASAKKNPEIEKLRYKLLKDKHVITVKDLGAGSRVEKSNVRRIDKIARTSLTGVRHCKLLKNIVEYTDSKYVLELGTSLGISTLYLNSAKNSPNITSVEGSEEIAKIAKSNFDEHGADVNLIVSDFDSFFSMAIEQNLKFDFFFIDGNHTKEATIRYFEYSKKIALPDSTFVFDDIRWSKGMYEAWQEIANSDYTGASVELYKMGIVFLKEQFKQKQQEIMFFL